MEKLPHIPLYVNDWSRDLEEHPLEIEGAWIRIICKLWWEGCSGESLKPIEQWARLLRVSNEKTLEICRYISENSIGNVEFSTNGNGKAMAKIICRRMKREWDIRQKRSFAGLKGSKTRWQSDGKAQADLWQTHDNDNDNDNDNDIEIEGKGKSEGKGKGQRIILVLGESPKRWEGITDEDKALWKKTYPGCDIEKELQEMVAYWDAQPRSALKINWKRTIVNRMKWIQDHGGTRGQKGDRLAGIKEWAESRGLK